MWTEERFKMEFGYSPTLWNDKGALEGEVGDTICGVEGWGVVTATKYIEQYGKIESIIEAVKTKEKLSKREQVLLNQVERAYLARSLKQMDLVDVPEVEFQETNEEAVKEILTEWGFLSIMKESWRLA